MLHEGLDPHGAQAEVMPELLTALNAFLQEHRRCGELDGGDAEGHVWIACECGASIAHPIQQPESPLQ